jgi:hypothetical protein
MKPDEDENTIEAEFQKDVWRGRLIHMISKKEGDEYVMDKQFKLVLGSLG